MYGSLLSSFAVFTLCTLLDPLYLVKAISFTSYLSISILDSYYCQLQITSSDHSTAIPPCTSFITLGLPSYRGVIRLAFNWMKSQYNLGFIPLDNRIIIHYVANRTYILPASKTRQIQVNYLLNQSLNSLQRSTIFNTMIC